MNSQTLVSDGENIRLTNSYVTDPYEAANHLAKLKNGRGMIKRGRSTWGRVSLQIPFVDMMMLETTRDADWELYDRTQDREALRRLLQRFPYWKICDGGI